MLKKIIPYDSPSNENEARERLREDISRLQDEIETNLDAIEQFVTSNLVVILFDLINFLNYT